MLTIDIDNLRIIPLDFWAFFSDASSYIGRFKFSKSQFVNENVFEYLNQEIMDNQNRRLLGIDMKNISSYPMHIFARISTSDSKVFFYNVEEKNIVLRMKEDLPQLIWLNETTATFSMENRFEIEDSLQNKCGNSRKIKHAEIMKKTMLSQDKDVYTLESSGLYSNCYLSVKKLFREVEMFYFTIFSMAQRVSELPKFDAFVTSSKNGAIIATILGDILNIKEIHLIGIGPKYSMELENSVDSIKQGKRYVYIFDFMCTGTELKIVSALISSKKGILKGAIGISRYKADINLALQRKISVLVEEKELGIRYVIAGSKEEIKMLKDGNGNE